ncbi:hypothetical protein [Streptomyces sviceus]|uniref:hypothetical protein n=1 Tax=Streptomyces sviceus TaxID=285530 RepID=UPI003320E2CF
MINGALLAVIMERDEYDADVELIAAELQDLVGCRGQPERVLKRLFAGSKLRMLPQVQSSLSRDSQPADLLQSFYAALDESLDRISGRHTLALPRGQTKRLDATDIVHALKILLDRLNEYRGESAEGRRIEARYQLGLEDEITNLRSWARPGEGVEYQLMRVLAAQLRSQPMQLDSLYSRWRIAPDRRIATHVLRVTALKTGNARITLLCGEGNLEQPLAALQAGLVHMEDDWRLARWLVHFKLENLRPGRQYLMAARLTNGPYAKVKPYEDTHARLIAPKEGLLESTVVLRFEYGHPDGLVWPFEGLLDDAEIQGSEPLGGGGYLDPDADGCFRYHFTAPKGRFGLAWRNDEEFDAFTRWQDEMEEQAIWEHQGRPPVIVKAVENPYGPRPRLGLPDITAQA